MLVLQSTGRSEAIGATLRQERIAPTQISMVG